MADRQLIQLSTKNSPEATNVIGIQVAGGAIEQQAITVTDLFGNLPVAITTSEGIKSENATATDNITMFTAGGIPYINFKSSNAGTPRLVIRNESALGVFTNIVNITADGKIGLNRSAPSELVHIYDATTPPAIRIEGATESAYIRVNAANTANLPSSTVISSTGANKIHLVAGNGTNPHLTVLSTGNVGIGIDDPTVLLEVGGSEFPAMGLRGTAAKPDGYIQYQLDTDARPSGYLYFNQGLTKRAAIYTGDGVTNPVERFTVLSDGNVGIGNILPTQKLQVAGTILAGLSTNNSYASLRAARKTSTNQETELVIDCDDNGGNIAFYDRQTNTRKAKITAAFDGSIGFWTDSTATPGTSKMFILPNGNVGIGTATPSNAFTVERSGNNIYSARIYNSAGEGGALIVEGGSNVGNPFPTFQVKSFQEVSMVVLNTGNVGIGTDTPAHGLVVKTDVIGIIDATDGTDATGFIYKEVRPTAGTVLAHSALVLSNDGGFVELKVREPNQPVIVATRGNNSGGNLQEWWFNAPYTTGTKHKLVSVGQTAGGHGQFEVFTAGVSFFKVNAETKRLSAVGLPVAAAGLSAGDIWNDGGTLKIV